MGTKLRPKINTQMCDNDKSKSIIYRERNKYMQIAAL